MKKWKLMGIILTLALVLTACGKGKEEPVIPETQEAETPTEETTPPTQEEDSAPWKSFSLEDLDGNTVTQDVMGEGILTIVNVWATYCGPCEREMPDLGELSEEYKDQGVQFYGIVSDALDEKGDPIEGILEEARKMAERTGASFPHLIPDVDFYSVELRDVYGVPTTYFINAKGEQLDSVVGALGKEEWKKMIDEKLQEISQEAE